MSLKIFGTGAYSCLPDKVLNTKLLTDNDKKLYSLLCGRAEMRAKGFDIDALTQNELADEINCTDRTIRRGIKKLTDLKLIDKIYNPGFPTDYNILDSEESLIPVHQSERKQKNKKIKETLSSFKAVTQKAKKEIIKLDTTQSDLKYYLASKLGERVSNKQIIVLYNAAIDNPNINGNLDIVKSIIDNCCDFIRKQKMVFKNIIGYVYKAIKNYSVTISEKDKSEFHEEAFSLSLKLKEDNDIRYHFTLNQCIALFSMLRKKFTKEQKSNQMLFNYIIAELVNKTKKMNHINDMFAYLREIIKNINTSTNAPIIKKDIITKSDYDSPYTERWALMHSPTYSGNVTGTGIPDSFQENDDTQSYDLSLVKPLFGC